MVNTRSIFIPSVNQFVRFKEFANEHLHAMFRTGDSLMDSIFTQYDIINDCILDKEILSKLNIIDCFVIFLNWRINCIDEELVLNSETGFMSNIDIVSWLTKVNHLAGFDFRQEFLLKEPLSGVKIGCNLPTLNDFIEIYKNHSLDDGTDTTRNTSIYVDIYTIGIIQSVNDTPIPLNQKGEWMAQLPSESISDFYLISEKIKEKINDLGISLTVNEGVVHDFSLDLIPTLNRMLCSGLVTNLLEQSVFLSKKGGISFESFMKMTPMESQHLIAYLQDQQKEEGGGIDEDEYEQIM